MPGFIMFPGGEDDVETQGFHKSTYYDLKHLRSSFDLFIESLGFDPVLSEKGDIAYMHDAPLDESCYREATNADIFVLIIGGRYGSEASGSEKKPTRSFFERYESIAKKEYENAAKRDIPVYILIDASVYSEYQTYLRNKDSKDVKYAHVDSVNVFILIEEILSKPRNNPVHTFEKFSEIELWLREQWAGLFRELLQRSSQQHQLAALSSQISELQQVNATLKRYLEAVMKGITPDASTELIKSEQKRLQELERREKIKTNGWFSYLEARSNISINDFENIMAKAESFEDFCFKIGRINNQPGLAEDLLDTLEQHESARKVFNEIRSIMGLNQFRLRKTKESNQPEAKATVGKPRR